MDWLKSIYQRCFHASETTVFGNVVMENVEYPKAISNNVLVELGFLQAKSVE